MKVATKRIRHYPPYLRVHYIGELKSQILVDIQQTWIKIQTNCILSAPLLIPLCVLLCMLSVFVLAKYLKY